MVRRIDAVVHIVDDSVDVRESVRFLVESVGLQARCYESADNLLETFVEDAPGCIILDLRMPGSSGIETLQSLQTRNIHLPVIIMTGHGDVPVAVRALKMGAVDFLEKPCNDNYLLEAVQRAVDIDVHARAERARIGAIGDALDTLTRREHDVLELLVSGHSNKEIARTLILSPKTVERHRARVMEKLQAGSFAELVSSVSLYRQKTTKAPGTDDH